MSEAGAGLRDVYITGVGAHLPGPPVGVERMEDHIGRVHGEPHDLDAFYLGPMQTAARVLAGPGHELDVVEAGRAWGLMQTGRFDEARAGLAGAARAARALPIAGFPAVLPATLARRPQAGPLEKRLRLLWAAVRGHL